MRNMKKDGGDHHAKSRCPDGKTLTITRNGTNSKGRTIGETAVSPNSSKAVSEGILSPAASWHHCFQILGVVDREKERLGRHAAAASATTPEKPT